MPSPLQQIRSGTDDPSAVATIGQKGDVYFRIGASGGTAYMKQDNGSSTNWTPLAFSQAETVIVKELQAAGTAGGDFNNGAWRTRVLNTTDNPKAWLALAANQITLNLGTYLVNGLAPAFRVNGHQTRLFNITDTATSIIGSSAHSSSADTTPTTSTIMGFVTIAGSKVFELQHQGTDTQAANGFGLPANFGLSEVYSQLSFTKIA